MRVLAAGLVWQIIPVSVFTVAGVGVPLLLGAPNEKPANGAGFSTSSENVGY